LPVCTRYDPVFRHGRSPASAFRSSHALTQIFAAAAIALVSTFAVADDAADKAIRQAWKTSNSKCR
jgi:hypothetical protein